MSGKTLLFAGGGTGGHVFPLVAVAHAVRRWMPDVHPVFVGTGRGMETQFVPEQGFELELLDVLPMRGRGPMGFVKGATRAASLIPESRKLLDRLEPRAVFSIGGYAAGPVSLAARTKGIPVALMEPNSVAGLANRLIAPFVQRAYVAFDPVTRHFSDDVVRVTGVPLRPGFDPVKYEPADPLRILVLGGSQGAKSLNEVLPRALAKLGRAIVVKHQCGQKHVAAVQQIYDDLGADFVEVTPFISDMPSEIARADLVVGRAGAGAVSEIAAVGRPSLLVPYPYASGDHQRVNAECLQEAGAAVCVLNEEASVSRMVEEIRRMVSDPSMLRQMAESAREFGRPDAADVVARDFLELAGFEVPSRGGPPPGGDKPVYRALGEVA